MSEIKFTKEEKEILTKKIQAYFRDELDNKIGQFDAQFLLDFFAEEVGVYFYNQGIFDAQAMLEKRMENITESLYELEKTTEFKK